MRLAWTADLLSATIDPGTGSAPGLVFEGTPTGSPKVNDALSYKFSSYDDYARWIIDQHLSLTVWPTEYVVQDMHLDFQEAKITPLRCLTCRISGLEDCAPDAINPIDCFVVEGLRVFLDRISAASLNPRPR